MNAEEVLSSPPIIHDSEPVTEERVAAFCRATETSFVKGVAPTFVTLYRHAEFEWLKRLRVDMHQLLHTEQKYEYFHPIRIGDRVRASTRVHAYRERRGLLFVTLVSDLTVGDQLMAKAFSSFVVRRPVGTHS